MKTGGLADVTHALPSELASHSELEVAIFLPYYQTIKQNKNFDIHYVKKFTVSLAWRNCYCGVFKATTVKSNLNYYFIDNDYYFGSRDSVYGDYDDMERFSFFSKAILEALVHMDFCPDVIHCNDWQTALIPLVLQAEYQHLSKLSRIKTLFTIHNIEYQGKVGDSFFDDVLGLAPCWRSALQLDGCLNFMKSAIVMADQLTTVSNTYATELQHAYYAHGMHHILREYSYKIQGIVNGIDPALFDPENSQQMLHAFDADCLAGKTENKLALQKQLGLDIKPDVPMIAMITRLVAHKGLDLVEFVAHELMQMPIQLVVTGLGEDRYQNLFWHMALQYPRKMSANIQFDPLLANRLYAAADLLLMPSKSEPCGLSQLIAMRYGTIPIVRETGGLVDTVPALNPETMEGLGFTFQSYNAHDMLAAIQNAVQFWNNEPQRLELIKKIMQTDTSWKQPAQQYIALYQSVRNALSYPSG